VPLLQILEHGILGQLMRCVAARSASADVEGEEEAGSSAYTLSRAS